MNIPLTRVTKLAELQVQLEKNMKDAEAAFEQAKKSYAKVAREDLPELMREVGLESVKLKSGITIELKEDVDVGIAKAMRDEAMAWLTKYGYGGLIKTGVAIAFGRNEEDKAQSLAASLIEQFGEDNVDVDRNVHHQTLKAFVRERMATGKDIPPFEMFGIRPFTEAKIKHPKA